MCDQLVVNATMEIKSSDVDVTNLSGKLFVSADLIYKSIIINSNNHWRKTKQQRGNLTRNRTLTRLVLNTLVRRSNTIANNMSWCKSFWMSDSLTSTTAMCKHGLYNQRMLIPINRHKLEFCQNTGKLLSINNFLVRPRPNKFRLVHADGFYQRTPAKPLTPQRFKPTATNTNQLH